MSLDLIMALVSSCLHVGVILVPFVVTHDLEINQ